MRKGKRLIGIIILILVIVLVLLSFKNPDSVFSDPGIPLWEMDEYKTVQLEDIQSIQIASYTEAGMNTELVADDDEIQAVFQSLSKLTIGEEVQTACDDNTTIYYIYLKNGDNVSIEIECDWIVLNNHRYEIRGNHEVRRRN